MRLTFNGAGAVNQGVAGVRDGGGAPNFEKELHADETHVHH
jgi:hypothetical protein